ncbi:uncharacterized protein J4E78_005107 [Alternaria triticimaculans]|uniref:uncharacterized protein n=1 Tax=Alternaria triticimaculans TaxID=297637 RepID=UPI0020C2129B|nr:uncharacterized protein J4E78_005107 [Alternaria triticimaculans]KAI4660404.1 hypothetical protein J4E78_005107 [Alternaria triticimaculans]
MDTQQTSSARPFLTLFPREIRDEIYTRLLTDLPPKLQYAQPSDPSPLPPLSSRLPPYLRLNRQINQEASEVYLRHTTIAVNDVINLELWMFGMPSSAWSCIQNLEIGTVRETDHVPRLSPAWYRAGSVIDVVKRCSGLKSLSVGVPGSMFLKKQKDDEELQGAKTSRLVNEATFGDMSELADMVDSTRLQKLELVCIDGNEYYYADLEDSDVKPNFSPTWTGLRNAAQNWAERFVEKSKKEGSNVDVQVKIIPNLGWSWRDEMCFYPKGRVTSFQYLCWFG